MLFSERLPPQTFKAKIVLLGFTGSIYQDIHSVPFQMETYPGVEIHATVIENILWEDFLTRPEATALIDALMLFLLGVGLGVALHRMRSLRESVLFTLLSLTMVFVIAYLAFRVWRIWLNLTFPWLFIVLDYLVITTYKYLTEEKQRKVIKNAFEHYVSPAVVKTILEATKNPTLGQEQKILSVLFSDIRGFTAIAEHMDSAKLTEFLDEFFTPMTEIVLEQGGTVDKYIGDAIMVFYGAPEEQPDHAVRACKTAVDMILRIEELWVRWKARGLPPIQIGLGINSGEMSVGNIGSKERFDYTIMGDHVNLASRLEGITKQYGTNIIISQFTYNFIGHDTFLTRELDTVRVKGKEEPVTIYELIGYDIYFQQMQALGEMFSQGLEAYKRRQWEEAKALFRDVLQVSSEDQPSRIYLRRCEEYQRYPPLDDWDGVFEMPSK
jgi:adenylate cyclase